MTGKNVGERLTNAILWVTEMKRKEEFGNKMADIA